jgi:hypothetical protein
LGDLSQQSFVQDKTFSLQSLEILRSLQAKPDPKGISLNIGNRSCFLGFSEGNKMPVCLFYEDNTKIELDVPTIK